MTTAYEFPVQNWCKFWNFISRQHYAQRHTSKLEAYGSRLYSLLSSNLLKCLQNLQSILADLSQTTGVTSVHVVRHKKYINLDNGRRSETKIANSMAAFVVCRWRSMMKTCLHLKSMAMAAMDSIVTFCCTKSFNLYCWLTHSWKTVIYMHSTNFWIIKHMKLALNQLLNQENLLVYSAAL